MPSSTAPRAPAAITTNARAAKILFPAKRINFNVDVMKHTSAGQLLLIGVQGLELGADEAKLLRRVQPGGFILFGRNIKTPGQLRKLIDDLRSLSIIEPIITIDQEGGRVSRLRLIGNEPPNAQQLRDKGDIELIRKHGEITGDLLRLFGFNLDLCPVLDISFDDEADNSLRGRCYGKTVELDMGAILNEYSFDEMLRLTFAAGNDLAMICHRIDKAEEALGVIEKLPLKQINRALESVAAFKTKVQPPTKFLESAFQKLDDAIWKLRVAVRGEERAGERSLENAARSPVERY